MPVVGLAVAGCLLGISGYAAAAPAKIKSCTKIFKASSAGRAYELTADLAPTSNADCIHVTAPGVTIDLAGHTITGH
ncbi:MAG TPA: hypothetical protein VMT58_03270, partial [Candidatus Binataceae bacterium]|nr:hypothetical protein [Candidatus Binataceae bacterium]